ncbi:MAG TPA: C1 family peptidase [Bdellovibrionota bacterium]|jgi:C1A family cysteine protease
MRALILFASLCFSNPGFAAVVDVESLQTKLSSKKAAWVAQDNWVNRLSKKEVQRMLGFPGKVRYGKDLTLVPAANALTAGTDSVDWRSRDGQNWVTPMLNQGNCGSCVAYATVGALETQMNISRRAPFLNMRYSTDMLFACGGGGCDRGWWPSSAASFLQRTGVVDEACMPATMSATGEDASCSLKCSDSVQRSQKVTSVATPSGIEAVKSALRRGPLVTTLDVYADFIVYSSGVYKHSTGEYLGGHAISIVGFDDARRAWIIRNSWGPEWGDHGFAYVSYDDESGVADSNWGFEVPGADGFVTPRNLRDRDFLSGTFAVEGVSTYANTTALAFQYTGAARGTLGCQGARCSMALLTSQLPDGRYEGVMEATHDGSTSTSDKRYFYVVNSRPEMKLSFSPKGFDPNQASGRVEFDIDAPSSPVPMQMIKLVVKQGDKVIYTKGMDVVLAKMTLGWRTIYIPNGSYTVQLVGSAGTYEVTSNSINVNVKN